MAAYTEMARLLDECVVWVCECHARGGSGFLVAPGLVLTCAHVVGLRTGDGYAVASDVEIVWQGTAYPGMVVRAVPDKDPGEGRWGFPDLALIEVNRLPEDHPHVPLGDALPRDRSVLYAAGFNKSYTFEPELARTWISYDAPFGPRDQWLLSLTERELEPGMSGGPILDPARGAVCGVLTASRNPGSPEGGFATPVTAVREHLPEIWAPGLSPAAPRARALPDPAFEAPKLTAARVRRLLAILPEQPAVLHRLHARVFDGNRLPPDPPMSDPMELILEAADAIAGDASEHPLDRLEALAVQGELTRPEGHRARIEVHLTASGMETRKYLVSVWSYLDDDAPMSEACQETAMDAEEIRPCLRTVFRRVLTRLSDVEDILVEFVLPLGMLSDGGDSVDEIYVDKPAVTLGMQFPVIVRTRDRITGAAAHQLRRWNRSRTTDLVPRWVDCRATESFADFYADFHAAEASTLVMLGFHPSDGPGGRALEAACDAGIPAAVWRRRRCSRNPAAGSADSTGPLAHCEADGVCSVERFERLIVDRLEGRSLESLPWLVRDLRVEAGRTGSGADHCGHDLTLLWDDPTRPDPDSAALVAPTGGNW